MHLFDKTHLLTLIFYLTAVRSTGTYPSLKYETSSVGCGCCLEIMLCQLLGQHWSAMRARSASLGCADKAQKFSDRFHHLPQMRQCAPDNHVLDLVVVCTLSPLWMLSHVALLLLWLHMAHIQVCTPQTRMRSPPVPSS